MLVDIYTTATRSLMYLHHTQIMGDKEIGKLFYVPEPVPVPVPGFTLHLGNLLSFSLGGVPEA